MDLGYGLRVRVGGLWLGVGVFPFTLSTRVRVSDCSSVLVLVLLFLCWTIMHQIFCICLRCYHISLRVTGSTPHIVRFFVFLVLHHWLSVSNLAPFL